MIDQTTAVDEVLAEVRRHKQDIASENGFDAVALGRALRAREDSDPRFKKQVEPGITPSADLKSASS